MIHFVKGDLLNSSCDYICHQVNCRGIMGAGIAKQIRDRWPWVFTSYKAYCERCASSGESPLGNIWGVRIDHDNQNPQWVVNMLAQEDYGYYGGRFTSYDAFAKCLEAMRDRLPKDKTIGFPNGIGCGLGGGDWSVILHLIKRTLEKDFEVYIYELEV